MPPTPTTTGKPTQQQTTSRAGTGEVERYNASQQRQGNRHSAEVAKARARANRGRKRGNGGKGNGNGKSNGGGKNGNGGGGGNSTPPTSGIDPQIAEVALAMAKAIYGPEVREARKRVQELRRTKGSIRESFDDIGEQLAGANATQQQFTQDTIGQVGAIGSGMIDNQLQVGAQQAGEANQQAALFGQSAKAAEARTQDAQYAGAALAQNAQTSAGFLGALGSIQTQGNVDAGLANNVREQEYLERLRGQKIDAKKDLAGVKGDRKAKAYEIAQAILSEDREFDLALKSLNQEDAENDRQYQLDRTDLLAQIEDLRSDNARADEQQNIDDENADADRAQAKRLAKLGLAETKAKRLDEKQISFLEMSGEKAGKDGKFKARTGKGAVRMSPSDYAYWTEQRIKVTTWKQNFKSGNPGNLTGMEPWQEDVGKFLAVNKPIPNRYRARLRSMFPGGHLPRSIAKALAPR